ncbi:MAG TPA: PIN domain-containing protein [Thermomicrobiales bacterium]|nr:PIN domain-containing protein [Thermomicrobiales bacterium]
MPAAPRFLDTNVLLRYFTRDDEVKARRALALLRRIEQGDERVVTTHAVIAEVVYTLRRFYKVPRERVRALVAPVIALRGLQLVDKDLYDPAFALYVERRISFADAYNAAYMQARGLTEIYTWDTDFDRIAGLSRVEQMLPDDERPVE